jgi:2-polyprenyl-3-methyl-5-hydroxy-6-metoxy-1,4-benzoquinol methylase
MRHRRGKPRRVLDEHQSDLRWDSYSLDLIVDRHPLAVFDQRWSWERPVYERICARVPEKGSILEVGSGLGANAVWFAAHGYRVVGIDHRPTVVDTARSVVAELGVDCHFEVADAFDLSDYRGFDLTVSFGVIEHWPRVDTVRALREQAACSPKVAAIVPTMNTRYTGEITDERFYTRRQMRGIFADAGLTDVLTHSYGAVPSRSGRVARWVLPAPALEALRMSSMRFAMALAVFGSSAMLPAVASSRA